MTLLDLLPILVGFVFSYCVWRAVRVPPGYVLVPREPTAAMLAGGCDEHVPGKPMRAGGDECPYFRTRRRIWAEMLDAA